MGKTLFISIFFVSALLISSYTVAAQNTAPKITVFTAEDSKVVQRKDSARYQNQYLNFYKWNYSLLPRGVFMLNYERVLGKKTSFEVGLGVTYRDYIFETLHTLNTNSGLDDPTFGFATEGGLRMYPAGLINFEGFYFALGVSYRKYSFVNNKNNYNGTIYKGLGYSMTDLRFTIGMDYESIFDWDVTSEWYFGVGMRKTAFSAIGDSNTYGALNPMVTENDIVPQILLGFKIGFITL